MLPEEEYPLYYKADDASPHVDLELEEEMVPFVIDTGSVYSMVSLKLVEDWGWREEIRPIEDSDEIGFINLDIKLKGVLFTDEFIVIDKDYNILGTRALCHFACTVDLDSQRLTFRDIDCDEWTKRERVAVRIEGREVRAIADTGYEGFVQGSMELAQELGLALKDISHRQVTLSGIQGDCCLQYEAEDVRVSACGSERRGAFHVVPEAFGD